MKLILRKERGTTLLSLLVLVGLISCPFHLTQGFYAVYAIISFFVLSCVDYYSSFLILLFLTQAFLGESDKPYLYIIDLFVLAILITGFVRLLLKKENNIEFKEWWIILPFLTSIILSFPLCLKEIVLDYHVYGLKKILEFIWVSRPIYRVFWFKEVLWVLTAFGTYFMLSRLVPLEREEYLKKVWVTLCVTLTCASFFGLLFYYFPMDKFFLSLSFKLSRNRILTSFAWNSAFFSNFSVLLFPFLFFYLMIPRGKVRIASVFTALIMSLFAAVLTVRRGMFLALSIEIFFGVMLTVRKGEQKIEGKRIAFVVLLLTLVTGVLFAQPRFRHERKYLLSRFKVLTPRSIDHLPRLYFYEVGLKIMEKEPVFGAGSGGFSRDFFDYYKGPKPPDILAAKASTHSVYLKMLAERGLFGFFSYIWLMGAFLYFGYKQSLKEKLYLKKFFLLATIVALIGEMLVYGLVFDPFYLRVFEILFWIYLAFIAVLARDSIPEIPFTKKKAATIVLIFFILLGYRLWRVKAEPISDHYEAGFYRWEIPRKGKDKRPYRLTSEHALKVFTVKGNVIRFRVCSNKPDVDKSPQTLEIYLNGKLVKRVTLRDHAWKEVEIPSKTLRGKKVFMDLQVDGTWIPYKYGRGRSRRVLGVIVSRIRQEKQ